MKVNSIPPDKRNIGKYAGKYKEFALLKTDEIMVSGFDTKTEALNFSVSVKGWLKRNGYAAKVHVRDNQVYIQKLKGLFDD